MRLRLTEEGLSHYVARTADKRARATGTLLSNLPSGDMIVEFPWGVGAYYPNEVELERGT